MIVVRNVNVLDPATETLNRCEILVAGDTIAEVGTSVSAPAQAREMDCSGMIALPGLANAHTHSHNNLTRALGDNWTLEDLRNYGPALNLNRSAEDMYLSAAVGAIEMVKTGCTAAYDLFSELPFHTEEGIAAVAQAYEDVGMRAVIAPMMADIPFYRTIPGLLESLPAELKRQVDAIGAAPTDQLLAVAGRALDHWRGRSDGMLAMALAPSIPTECSDAFMLGCRRLAHGHRAGLHTHLAETKIQAIAGHARWGRSITAQLDQAGVLAPGFVGAHGVWLDADDMALLAERGAAVAHNPASNLKLGSGIAPLRELLDAGVAVGLGCDGSMSSDNQNMFEAMRIAALVNKVRFAHRPERWVGAGDILRLATAGSAKLLGLAPNMGRIEVGAKADIVLLESDSIFLSPMNNPVNSVVYCESGMDVHSVLIAGRLVVENRKVVTVDEHGLRSRAQAAAERLAEANRPLFELSRRVEPYLRSACATCAARPFHIDRYAEGRLRH